MKTSLLIMIIGALLTVCFTYIEYRESKATKRHFMTVFILDLIIMAIGIALLLVEL